MRNSLLPTLAVLVLVALVVLIPEPESTPDAAEGLPAAEVAGADVAQALLELDPLELYSPPAWARQQGGRDVVTRNLDRLSWGPHAALLASRDTLHEHSGELAPVILDRLQAIGDHDPIQAAALIATLGPEDAADPRMLEELNRRCLSDSGLVAKAALRCLRQVPVSEALGGALMRRHDAEESIRESARALICEAARRGDAEARDYILQDLRARPSLPSQLYITALGEASYDEESMEVLRLVLDEAPLTERFATLGALARHGDERAIAELEQMIASADHIARFNAMFVSAMAGRPLGHENWQEIVNRELRQETTFLMSMLKRTIQLGDEHAPLAYDLLDQMARSPGHVCHVLALDLLYELGDPASLERTRDELANEMGGFLNQAIDRVLRGPRAQALELAPIAEERLADPELGEIEQVLFLNFLAQVKPSEVVAPVVDKLVAGEPLSRETVLPALVSLGELGLEHLAQRLDKDRAAGLYVLAAAHVRSPVALPVLERIASDADRDAALRRFAMDGIVRVRGGDREGTLRRVADATQAPELRERAMRLFWNYL